MNVIFIYARQNVQKYNDLVIRDSNFTVMDLKMFKKSLFVIENKSVFNLSCLR